MQYELWARKKPECANSSSFEKIDIFYDINESYYLIDMLDTNEYCEAIILLTDWQKQPSAVYYKDFREIEKRKIKK